ncbi:glycosyltransferase family 4 protein [Sphingobacterium detergens]|uniref:Glycosyltransferase involved in cell wall biosynthesis n=1 Tax=Sphingobacterium detergens TaxID=1145106 RepID=A0A420ALS4_SPHD1|nr:glycosyltransferase family 4 protein [Sphingobacterium detergens]RKE45406.1 glycosyltransferase involved in cell wall biosynthesis [Sphingobacterium detergens]
MKKILHVINVSFVVNHFFGNQFSHFSKKGYDFTVACTEDEYLYKQAKEKGFKVFPVAVLKAISPLQDALSILRLTRFIRKERFPIVVAHSPKGGLIGITAAYLARVEKRVFFRHGVVFETAKGFKRTLLIMIERFVGALATDVVIVSESLQRLSKDYKLNNPAKSMVLGKGTCSGIDIQRFQYRPKQNSDFVVGYVGRLVRDKGVVELIQGWLQFADGKSDVYLHIVGPLEVRDAVPEDTLQKIKNSPSIRFFDFVEDTASCYNEMDVFILPSYREGFPVGILEASASRLPIITTKSTGCINAIQENITGIYTEIAPKPIAEAIDYYYKNPQVRQEHGRNGVLFVKNNFSEQKLFVEIENKILN